MSLTLPIQVGKQYVRRDGAVVTAKRNHMSKGDYVVFIGVEDEPTPSFDEHVYVRTGSVNLNNPIRSTEHPFDLIADHVPATGHPHAALMAQYATDAAETAEPWLRWESRAGREPWRDHDESPRWLARSEYRRKPKTIRIGEYDVPEPVRATPNHDIPYYFPNLDSAALIRGAMWSGVEFDHYMLARGLVHLTREAAEQHAQALLAFTQVQA